MVVPAEHVGVALQYLVESTGGNSLNEPAEVLAIGVIDGSVAADDRAAILVLFDLDAGGIGDHSTLYLILLVHVSVTSS